MNAYIHNKNNHINNINSNIDNNINSNNNTIANIINFTSTNSQHY